MTQSSTAMDIRQVSKLLFGNRLRLELAVAIALSDGVVFARQLAEELGVNDNQVAPELRNFAQAGLLERIEDRRNNDAVGRPRVLYSRRDSSFWGSATKFLDELRAAEPRPDRSVGPDEEISPADAEWATAVLAELEQIPVIQYEPTERSEKLVSDLDGTTSSSMSTRPVAIRSTKSARRVRRQPEDEEFRLFAKGSLPGLLRGTYMLLRDIDLAEDIVQATMLRVFRHWREARQSPEVYSHETLLKLCRDHLRRNGKDLETRDQNVPLSSNLVSVEPPNKAAFEGHAMTSALEHLEPLQRQVLVLRFYFGLSTAQTADMLQLTKGDVKSATHRGLGILRELMATEATAAPDQRGADRQEHG